MDGSIRAYLDHLKAERKGSAHTLRSYEHDLAVYARFLRELFGDDSSPSTSDPFRLRRYSAWLSGQGYSPSTVARRLACLRSYFRYLRRNGLVDSDPSAGLRNPKQARGCRACCASMKSFGCWTPFPATHRRACGIVPCSRHYTAAACGSASSSGLTWTTSISNRNFSAFAARVAASDSARLAKWPCTGSIAR